MLVLTASSWMPLFGVAPTPLFPRCHNSWVAHVSKCPVRHRFRSRALLGHLHMRPARAPLLPADAVGAPLYSVAFAHRVSHDDDAYEEADEEDGDGLEQGGMEDEIIATQPVLQEYDLYEEAATAAGEEDGDGLEQDGMEDEIIATQQPVLQEYDLYEEAATAAGEEDGDGLEQGGMEDEIIATQMVEDPGMPVEPEAAEAEAEEAEDDEAEADVNQAEAEDEEAETKDEEVEAKDDEDVDTRRRTRRRVMGSAHAKLRPGVRVAVFWEAEDSWFPGTVGAALPGRMTVIDYDDGDQEKLDMANEKYRILPSDEAEDGRWSVPVPGAVLHVGTRVQVYWPEDEAWYKGTVKEVGKTRVAKTTVEYDDGEREKLNMNAEMYRVLLPSKDNGKRCGSQARAVGRHRERGSSRPAGAEAKGAALEECRKKAVYEEADRQDEEADRQDEELMECDADGGQWAEAAGMQAEEAEMQAEEAGMQAEEAGVQTEEAGVQAEEAGMQAEETGMQAKETGVQAEEAEMQAEETGMRAEEAEMQAEEAGMQAEEAGVQAEEAGMQAEEAGMQAEVAEEAEIQAEEAGLQAKGAEMQQSVELVYPTLRSACQALWTYQNVYGCVVDWWTGQASQEIDGADRICTMRIIDASTDIGGSSGVEVRILFSKEEKPPQPRARCGDIVRLQGVKIGVTAGRPSLTAIVGGPSQFVLFDGKTNEVLPYQTSSPSYSLSGRDKSTIQRMRSWIHGLNLAPRRSPRHSNKLAAQAAQSSLKKNQTSEEEKTHCAKDLVKRKLRVSGWYQS
ncbi:hypothetical protein CYMTET_34822 [Cymbomonas tetramitiformis]|uniref:Tudor domain-containing protein n=1 Tax=Cymbomonas tetramitiformis TaxID=36881 RepID=A0AAE0KPK4_9CHLO|nr:hypothetical protein CYMTET_34822 [Cymbomonas tetramitiformis]